MIKRMIVNVDIEIQSSRLRRRVFEGGGFKGVSIEAI